MNRRLLMLNGLAIIAVVCNHASHDGFIAMFWWTDRYLPVTVPNYDQMGSFSYYLLVAMQKLALFSVPTFLFITGVFLAYAARGAQTRLTWGVIGKRVFNLLPPYVFWTLVYFVGLFLLGNVYKPQEYLLSMVWVEYSPFFFIPLVIIYYLLSPFLAPLAKNHPRLLVGIAAAVLGAGLIKSYIDLSQHLPGVTVNQTVTSIAAVVQTGKIFEYFFYYAAGLTVGFYQPQLKAFLERVKFPLLALTIAMAVLAVVEAEWVFQSTEIVTWRTRTLTLPTAVYSFSFILTFLAFDQVKIPFSNLLYQTGMNTLGIYLVHKSVLLFLPKIVYHILPIILGMQVIYQSVLVSVAVGVPLLLMMLTRISPIRSHYRTIFG